MIFSSDLYLAFALAVLFLPLPAISVWFHRRIVRTPGGRRLMRAQRQAGRVNISLNAPASLRDGLRMFKDLRAGKYGQDARHLAIADPVAGGLRPRPGPPDPYPPVTGGKKATSRAPAIGASRSACS